jgi:hypothetical protein
MSEILTGDGAKIPQIPQTSVIDPQLRPVVEGIRSIFNVRAFGKNEVDRWVTWRDLVQNNIVMYRDGDTSFTGGFGSKFFPIDQDPEDFTAPPAPVNLTAVSAALTVILEWNNPLYANLAYAEIWRSTTNVLGNAVRIGTTPSFLYADAVGAGSITYYYWVRFVSRKDVVGPYNSLVGTLAATGLVGNVDLGPLIIEADNLAANAVEEGKIKDFAVTTTKIANLAVGNAAIANGAITNAKIGDLAVDSAKIADAAIVTAKIANGTITNAKIGTAEITGAKIAGATIGTANITNGAITNALIGDAQITGAKIANATIGTANIVDSNITNAKIGDGQITTAKIGDLQVDTLKIAGNAITVPLNTSVGSLLGGNGAYQTALSLTVTNTSSVPMGVVLLFSGVVYYNSGLRTTAFRVLADYVPIAEFGFFSGDFVSMPSYQIYHTISPNSSVFFIADYYGQDGTAIMGYRSLTALGVKR